MQVLSARAIREISPPDAIFSMGLGSSPRLGDTRNSTASLPEPDASAATNHDLENGALHRQPRKFHFHALGQLGGGFLAPDA